MARRSVGFIALLVGALLSAWLVILIRDFVTIDYAGYEVGLQTGAILVVGVLAFGLLVLGLVVLVRSKSRGRDLDQT